MRKVRNNRFGRTGFTIVELSFSIAFIAILSIVMIVVINNAVSAYHRGITLNQLNTMGMDLTDDMRTAVQGSSARPVENDCATVYVESNNARKSCETDGGMMFVNKVSTAKVQSKGGTVLMYDTPIYGAFCTGKYSYVWNSGYFFNEEYVVADGSKTSLSVKYKVAGEADIKTIGNFKLLKIQDDERLACKVAAGYRSDMDNGGSYNTSKTVFAENKGMIDVSKMAVDEDPVDILAGNNNLVLYDMVAAPPAESGSTSNTFYAMSFVLGTIQGGINVKASGNYCTPPEDSENAMVENFDYCAINKFNFAAQATGG